MSNSINVAASALTAFSTRQQVTSNNLANVNTENFGASRVTLQDRADLGVAASVQKTNDSVDISREATDLITNMQGFKANVKTVKVADEMTREALKIKA